MPRLSGFTKWVKRGALVLLLVGVGAVGVVGWQQGWYSRASAAPPGRASSESSPSLLDLLDPQAEIFRLPDEKLKKNDYRTATAVPPPPPEPIKLYGSTFLDPDRLARVRSLFAGQVVSIEPKVEPRRKADGSFELAPITTKEQRTRLDGTIEQVDVPRAVRHGDRVYKGQPLVVVWSKDVGEKKSELIDAISRLHVDENLLARYEALEKGVIAERNVNDARRNVESDRIAVEKAERTLRSWGLPEDEIRVVRAEAERIIGATAKGQKPTVDKDAHKNWAKTVLYAPHDGIVVERNANPSDVIDPTVDLFKIADISRLQALMNVYEEDLAVLKALPTDRRQWKVSLRSARSGESFPGEFELSGRIIDPTQHSGTVTGWLDNSKGLLDIGQFIEATVELPPDPGVVSVPASAVIEDGGPALVIVATGHPGVFQRRQVEVVRRARDHVLLRTEPTAAARERGVRGVAVGEKVVSTGALLLAAEFDRLKAGQK